MHRTRRVVLALRALAVLMVGVAAWAWMRSAPQRAHPAWNAPSARIPADPGRARASAGDVRDLIARNPFRRDRRPTAVRFDPWGRYVTAAVPRTPARPRLALVGLVGGPPWLALLEGIPGREAGAVLTEDDAVGGIRLIGVRGDTVRVSGFDTTWVLTPRQVGP